MFDDTAAYLIRTGRIMRRNGLYMIVLSRDSTEIQGKRRNGSVCMYVCVCVYLLCVRLNNLITHVDPHSEIMFVLSIDPAHFPFHCI